MELIFNIALDETICYCIPAIISQQLYEGYDAPDWPLQKEDKNRKRIKFAQCVIEGTHLHRYYSGINPNYILGKSVCLLPVEDDCLCPWSKIFAIQASTSAEIMNTK